MKTAGAAMSSILSRCLAQQQQVLVAAAAAAADATATGCSQLSFRRASQPLNVAPIYEQQVQPERQQRLGFLHRSSSAIMQLQPLEQWCRPYSSQAAAAHQLQRQEQWCRPYSSQAAAMPSSKDLADILKLQLLQDKTPDEVEHIWMSHHEGSSSHVATVMSKEEHKVLAARGAASPLFVLPLRKPPQGFCTLLVQWQRQQALVTTLEEYKQRGSNATTHFSVTCYNELGSSHGLVLVRGDLLSPQLINTAEARTVMELVRALYTSESYQLVYGFNHTPEKFSFLELLEILGMTGSSNNP